MAEKKTSQRRQAGHIKDARRRMVTQLDPIAMHFLRQHDVIEADLLAAIANEKGVRIARKERAALIVAVGALLTVASLFLYEVLTGSFGSAPLAQSASLVWFSIIPWLIWMGIKRARFGKVAAAMLEYLRCPHCGYDLRLLPTDPEDGATVCPECGCAWRLEGERK